jgi:hypothetical protein
MYYGFKKKNFNSKTSPLGFGGNIMKGLAHF